MSDIITVEVRWLFVISSCWCWYPALISNLEQHILWAWVPHEPWKTAHIVLRFLSPPCLDLPVYLEKAPFMFQWFIYLSCYSFPPPTFVSNHLQVLLMKLWELTVLGFWELGQDHLAPTDTHYGLCPKKVGEKGIGCCLQKCLLPRYPDLFFTVIPCPVNQPRSLCWLGSRGVEFIATVLKGLLRRHFCVV